MIRSIISLLFLVAAIQGFVCNTCPRRDGPALNALSRSQFLVGGVTAFGFVALTPAAANAKEDPLKKGTKDDPAYQFCLSTCMYECTKPKGEETKLRKECLPECKQKCATTKQQLMIGTPLSK